MREIKRISYSYLNTFTCPYQAFLRYEAQLKIKITDNLAFGNALHYALEKGHDGEWNNERSVKLFLTEFKRIINDDEVFIGWPKQKKMEAEGTEIINLYDYGLQTKKFPYPLYVEKAFELPFEDEIAFVGKIDRIEQGPKGLIISDYKSSKYEPDPWFLSHDLQMTCYAWACLELFGELPEKLIWHHIRNGKRIETTRTMEDIEGLKQMMHNVLEMNRQGIRHRVYHKQVCGWCDFAGETCDDKELEAKLVAESDALKNDRAVA